MVDERDFPKYVVLLDANSDARYFNRTNFVLIFISGFSLITHYRLINLLIDVLGSLDSVLM